MRRLNTASVLKKLDVTSRETLRQLVKRGLLPEPIKDAAGGANFWLESDIDDYIARQAQVRDRTSRAPELSQPQGTA